MSEVGKSVADLEVDPGVLHCGVTVGVLQVAALVEVSSDCALEE